MGTTSNDDTLAPPAPLTTADVKIGETCLIDGRTFTVASVDGEAEVITMGGPGPHEMFVPVSIADLRRGPDGALVKIRTEGPSKSVRPKAGDEIPDTEPSGGTAPAGG